MRLDKFLAKTGYGSRSLVKKIIKQKKVYVNDILVLDDSLQIDEFNDSVIVDGKKVTYIKYIYIMLNKPRGVVSAVTDSAHKTVVSLVPEYAYLDIFPVGRLDIDTEGLLILTNDGEFAHDITSPSKHVDKTYLVRLDKDLSLEQLKPLEEGIMLDGTITLPASLAKDGDDYFITIREGKYHQVKRMFKYLGSEVIYLKRIKIGNLELDESLRPGEYKLIKKEDI